MFPCSLQINNVGTCRGYADVLQGFQFGNMLPSEFGFVRQKELGVPGALNNLLCGCASEDAASTEAFQLGPTQISGIKSVSIQDNNIHDEVGKALVCR